jgi:hypothetical protein
VGDRAVRAFGRVPELIGRRRRRGGFRETHRDKTSAERGLGKCENVRRTGDGSPDVRLGRSSNQGAVVKPFM